MTLISPAAARTYLQRRIDQLQRARRILGSATVTGTMMENMIGTARAAIVFIDALQADGCANEVFNLQRDAVRAANMLTVDGRVLEENIGQYLALSEIMLATDGIETIADMKAWSLAHGFDFDADPAGGGS